MEAASRKSGGVEEEREGPLEPLLAFYFLFFCFSLYFYKETYERPDSPLRSFSFFLSFLKLVFLETKTKIKQDMIS